MEVGEGRGGGGEIIYLSLHCQRPGKGLQARQSESLRAQDLAIQKPDQKQK